MEVVSPSTSCFSKSHSLNPFFLLSRRPFLRKLTCSFVDITGGHTWEIQSSVFPIYPWKKLPLSFQAVSWLDCLLFPSNVVYHPIEKCCPAPTTVFSLYLFHKNLLRTCQMNYFSAPMYVYILKLCESRQSVKEITWRIIFKQDFSLVFFPLRSPVSWGKYFSEMV